MANSTMRREMEAQGPTWSACFPTLALAAGAIAPPFGRIFAGGCGDSIFAPMALRNIFLECELDVQVASAMEIAGYRRIRATDTVILSSISGGTTATLAAARLARSVGARVVGLTCVENSPLAELATDVLLLPYKPISRRTPHTLDYLVTIEALWLLAIAWSKRSPTYDDVFGESIATTVRQSLDMPDDIVRTMHTHDRVFWLGSGGDLGTASYGAAKMHEAGGLNAIVAETENFIHGQNFMLGSEDLVILVATGGLSRYRAEGLAAGLGRLAKSVLTFNGAPFPDQAASISELARVIGSTIQCQAFVFHLAEALHLDVELSRGGRPNGEQYATEQSQWMKATFP